MNKLIITFDSVLGTNWSYWTNQFSPLVHSILGIEWKTDVRVLQISAKHVWKLFGTFVCKHVTIQKQRSINLIMWNFTRYSQNLSVLVTIGQNTMDTSPEGLHAFICGVHRPRQHLTRKTRKSLFTYTLLKYIAIFSRPAVTSRDGTSNQDVTDDMNIILNSLITHYPLFGGTFWATEETINKP
jgi:hypothetical protein